MLRNAKIYLMLRVLQSILELPESLWLNTNLGGLFIIQFLFFCEYRQTAGFKPEISFFEFGKFYQQW
jgi:hypothetical protein